MKENNDDINIVEMLREKTEEADLNQYLKGTLGGYTKKSVMEYLVLLHKQQQTSKETFSKNLQTLFNEKESIKKNNDTLLSRLNKVEAEYQNLTESIRSIKLENTEFSAQDIISLKGTITTLEEELKINKGHKISLEKKTSQLNNDKDDLEKRLEQSKQGTNAQKEMLRAERIESKKQRDMVSDISRLLEEERDEIKYLKGVMTDGKVAQLTLKVNELTEQLTSQTEIIEKYNSESVLKEETNATLINEIYALKQRISNLYESTETLNSQNDKMLLSNENITNHLEAEYKKSIALINEKSNITIDKLIAQKKLSDAESQISFLELQVEKCNKSEKIKIQNEKLAEARE